MRDIKKVEWLYLDIRDIREICNEVYGKEFDIQMGEYSNGSYLIVKPESDLQGYWTGIVSDRWAGNSYDNATWVEISDEEAIKKWVDNVPSDKYSRPFDKVVDGEYDYWQPDFEVILKDLVAREEIPDGTYFISIDW